MPKLPNPPPAERLAALGADERVLSRGAGVFRVYFLGGTYPGAWNAFRFYGPTKARFDHHLGPEPHAQARGILYLADHPWTCLAEVFQARRRIDVLTHEPMLVLFELARPVRLLDLTGYWPTRAGASLALSTGPRSRTRRWAQAIYTAFPHLDGVYYASSMGAGRPSIALFERGADALPTTPTAHRALADPLLRPLVQRAALTLGYDLL